MGIFTSKKKKNILEILGIEVNEELKENLKPKSKDDEFIDYYARIEDGYDLFDNVVFRIFGEEADLSGDTSFNMIFISDEKQITIEKLSSLVNSITKEFGRDRNKKGIWTEQDAIDIANYWEGREWLIDKKGNTGTKLKEGTIAVNLHFDLEDGISFSILGANYLIK